MLLIYLRESTEMWPIRNRISVNEDGHNLLI
jgi:hypothetical protein